MERQVRLTLVARDAASPALAAIDAEIARLRARDRGRRARRAQRLIAFLIGLDVIAAGIGVGGAFGPYSDQSLFFSAVAVVALVAAAGGMWAYRAWDRFL